MKEVRKLTKTKRIIHRGGKKTNKINRIIHIGGGEKLKKINKTIHQGGRKLTK